MKQCFYGSIPVKMLILQANPSIMNFLIADSGSTKTEWVRVTENGTETRLTSGINPVHMSSCEIEDQLAREFTRPEESVSSVRFYGSGCIPSKRGEMSALLSRFFRTDDVRVESDLTGAARGLWGNRTGIACILGTGSNSAFYDGKNILKNVPPLGYVLGDEGSGADLGKRFIGDLLKGLLPADITADFYREYPMEYAEIIEHVYRRPNTNRFLAGFTPFIARYLDQAVIRNLVENAFSDFTERNLCQYREYETAGVSFVGSIAYYFSDSLRKVMDQYGFSVEKIERSPMAGLIDFHIREYNRKL